MREKTIQAATGIAAAMGVLAEAEADVVYFQPNLNATGTDFWAGASINIDPFNQTASSSPISSSLNLHYFCWGSILQGNGQTDESGNVGAFLSSFASLGDTVSSSGDYNSGLFQYGPPEDIYWGFRISNTNSPTEYNYGYVHLSAYYADGTYNLSLHEAAYESDVGTSITVGAVPEPATGALLMLSVLLIGLFRKLKLGVYGIN